MVVGRRGRKSGPAEGIGERFRYYRLLRGWETQTQAADAIGISQQEISKIESGKEPNPSLETLRLAADAFECSIDDLAWPEIEVPKLLREMAQRGELEPPPSREQMRKLARLHLLGEGPATEQDYQGYYAILRRMQRRSQTHQAS